MDMIDKEPICIRWYPKSVKLQDVIEQCRMIGDFEGRDGMS